MAGGLGWAMEKMGWRMPIEDEDLMEDTGGAEVREYPFPAATRTESEPPFSSIKSSLASEARARTVVADPPAERQRIVTVHPRTFADALVVGESFRDGIPVIMNLTDMDDAEARRIIDFAGGLTFGLCGAIERVTTRVFLLSPEDLEVTHDRGAGRSPSYR